MGYWITSVVKSIQALPLHFISITQHEKGLVALAALLLTVTSFAQQKIKTEDLSKHVGDSVTFCTKIFGGIFLDRSKEQLTLLNAGGNYPNAPLTIVIGSDTREKFANKPEVFYKDKEVCITGKISLYKEKPQIVVCNEKQLVVK
ncbi:MAG: hypothetical protein IPK90_12420 [Chitinophagaceae bacterium]|nr:hypothetical protein [Chitinophagaceae bacterium]